MLSIDRIKELRDQYKALQGRIDCAEDIEVLEHHCIIHNVSLELITMSDDEFYDMELGGFNLFI